METLLKIFAYFRQVISDSNGYLSSTRAAMMVVILWFLADWYMEFHSRGFYTLSWEKLTLVSSAFGLKAVQNLSENQSGNGRAQ